MSDRIQRIKRELRASVYERRKRVNPVWGARASALLCAHALELPELRMPGTALVYLSMAGEADLSRLADVLVAAGWRMAVTARQTASGRYRPCEWSPGEEIERGPFDVPQPLEKRWIEPSRLDIAFVPGLAFDLDGGRLGHGAGHYDRMLPDVRPDCMIVGVCFEFQCITAVPVQAHDVRMRAVVTERGLIRCARGRKVC